jgi:hypothetical protein
MENALPAQAALAEFPELEALMLLRQETGWAFAASVHNGEVTSVQGVRVWPRDWADAIGILDRKDAQAVRANPTGHIVWKREGGLIEVVEGLLGLPAPDERTAPHLVIGIAPTLWTPGGRR